MESGAGESKTVQFQFTGKASEYFSIWIVNVCLTILTLGIYSAWAKVRNNQYFYGNTILDGSSFQYLADPVKILKGRIIAFVLFAAYYFSGMFGMAATLSTLAVLMLLTPAFMVMSMSFRMRNSAWRNVRFDFHKDFRKAYVILAMPVVLVGIYMAAVLSFQSIAAGPEPGMEQFTEVMVVAMLAPLAIMLFFPWWEYLINRFQLVNSRFGKSVFKFGATPNDYYLIYIAAIVVMVVAGIAIFMIMAGVVAATVVTGADEKDAVSSMPFILAFSWIAILPLYLWAGAYIQAKKTNLIISSITVGDHKLKCDLKVGYMMYLYITNTLAIVFSMGLMMPWAKIRTARYKAERTQLLAESDLAGFVAGEQRSQSALGEEVGELFDMDLGM